MSALKVDIVDIDLDSGSVHRSFAQKTLSEADANGNTYGIRLFRKGQPVNIGGATCMGYFIRNGNGDTVVINGGMFSGNEAYITLPASCYVYEGAFTLVIKLVGSGWTEAMRIVDGTVVNSVEGSPVDPGSVVPSLDSLMAVIGRAEAAADEIADIDIYASQIEGDNYEIVVSTGG